MDPQTRQNLVKMDAKRPPPLDFIFGSLFGWCLLATSTSQSWFFEPPLQPQHVFAKIEFRSWPRSLLYFCTNLAALSFPKPNKILPTTDPEKHENSNRFLNRFWCHVGSILEANLKPSRRFFRSKNRPQIFQHPPRLAQTPPRPPKTAPRTFFNRCGVDFGTILNGLWVVFYPCCRQHGPIPFTFPTGRRHQAVRLLQ